MKNITIIIWLSMTVFILFTGCAEDPQNQKNKDLMPAWSSFSVGDAAPVRTWTDDRADTWTVVGDATLFVVFRHSPGKDWEQVYTNKDAPQAVRVRVEQ